MPTQKIWPRDKLGNEIKEGKMLLLKLPEAEAMFYVMKVEPASFIHSTEGPVPVAGEIELVLKFQMPFAPDQAQLHRSVVVEQSKQEESREVQ